MEASSFTAIGAVSDSTLGFFDLGLKDYREIKVEQQAEVVSILGDVTVAEDDGEDGSRAVHRHMLVALPDPKTGLASIDLTAERD